MVAGLDEAGRGCERPDAEILTNNGWKIYTDVDIINDKVLSYTGDGYMEWQKIEKVIEKDFQGNLLELKNRGIRIVVTPDHYFTVLRRVFKRDRKNNNRLELVGYKIREERKMVTKLLSNDVIPRGGKWKGINKRFFKLPKLDKSKEKPIDIRLWVAFLGIFLSEGSVSYDKNRGSYRITISQTESVSKNQYKKIYSLLGKFPFKFNKFKTGFTCYNKQLYAYLKRFGKCYAKFIPDDIKRLSPHLLNILINWMILGDGTCYTNKNRKKVCVYYTVSKKLKDDIEEVLLKAGWTYHTIVRIPRDGNIEGRLIKKENRVPCFEIRLRRNNKAQVKSLHRKKLFYKGKVFCLQLQNYHNFYVRRNGTGYFTGNSLAGPVVACAVCVKPGLVKPDLVIRDSKKMSFRQREKAFEVLTKNSFVDFGIGKVSEKVIDRINILEATKLAMQKAVGKLKKKPDFLILDGNFKINSLIPQKPIIKADGKVFSCMAAGIIAKVTRDRIMQKYHKKYPCYGFDRHKGYPTKDHYNMLKRNGFCKLHRKTFRLMKIK